MWQTSWLIVCDVMAESNNVTYEYYYGVEGYYQLSDFIKSSRISSIVFSSSRSDYFDA
jgi:UDP-glucose 4-epimerase